MIRFFVHKNTNPFFYSQGNPLKRSYIDLPLFGIRNSIPHIVILRDSLLFVSQHDLYLIECSIELAFM